MDEKEKKKPEEAEDKKETPVDEPEKKDESAENASDSAEQDNPAAEEEESGENEIAPDDGQADENGEGAEKKDVPANEPEEPVKTEDGELKAQLLSANAQLGAYKAGIRADFVEDAVALAMYDAKKNGEITLESVTEALDGVINRHPEWKGYYEEKQNFRIGADGMQEAILLSDEISKIFGN